MSPILVELLVQCKFVVPCNKDLGLVRMVSKPINKEIDHIIIALVGKIACMYKDVSVRNSETPMQLVRVTDCYKTDWHFGFFNSYSN